MQSKVNKTCCALAILTMLSGVAAQAGTATGQVTMTGTIVPPPPSCTFGAAPILRFNGNVPTGPRATNYLRSDVALSLTCTAGAPYSLSTPFEWSPVTIGWAAAGISIWDADSGQELHAKPRVGVGTGAPQMLSIIGFLGGESTWDDLDPRIHIGAASGSVPFVVSY